MSKQYSFAALPGDAVKKRPRRRSDEIERIYNCSWTGCTKSYGTLNHLNAHIVMERHGSKRTSAEFQELRKQQRKANKGRNRTLGTARFVCSSPWSLHPEPIFRWRNDK
ncbi:hypothetical protein EDB84DRAFT_1397510 [Lactarius hengduanensis]|nr:hypothetical protein EDB84DRAFT_1397510 [Lactarius hengduanensis]